jgi:hypothetical protein
VRDGRDGGEGRKGEEGCREGGDKKWAGMWKEQWAVQWERRGPTAMGMGTDKGKGRREGAPTPVKRRRTSDVAGGHTPVGRRGRRGIEERRTGRCRRGGGDISVEEERRKMNKEEIEGARCRRARWDTQSTIRCERLGRWATLD